MKVDTYISTSSMPDESKQEPTIDILLAVYNGEKFINQQLDSLLNQRSPVAYRILVADDGSSDASPEILKRYASLHHNIVLLIDAQLNLGAVGRFSWLAEQSTAPYIMFCDQDDVWMPQKLEQTFAAMQAAEEKNPGIPLLIHTDLQVVDWEMNEAAPSFIELRGIDPNPPMRRLLVENPVTGCTVLINRPLLHLALPFPSNVYMHDWWLALLAKSCGKLIYLPKVTIKYRQHATNSVGIRRVELRERLVRFWALWGDQSAQIMYDRSHTQAQSLLARAASRMYIQDRKSVEAFAASRHLPVLRKRWHILRGGFLQKHPLRQIMLLLRLK